ncbi:MAG: hypothetical protein K0Q59_498 [Paenibacillus sp.]|nr:hypothetical protein [Paenibacillus sp.]
MFLSTQHSYASAVLNQYASRVNGPLASFDVPIWGANPRHLRNSIHRHSAFWFGYVLSGQGSYVEEDRALALVPGAIFCSRPGVWRQITSDSGLSLLWVSFRVEESASSEAAIEPFRYLETTTEFIRYNADATPTAKLWEAIWLQAEQLPLPYISVLNPMAYALLMSFVQLFGETRASNPTDASLRQEKSSVLLRQARWFIADNLSLSLKLEEVAHHLHVSGRHLSRLFMNEEGLSFSGYLRKLRMEKAYRDLAGTDMPLDHIARECGFGNIYYFTRVFKSETGLPPGQYRSKYRAGNP